MIVDFVVIKEKLHKGINLYLRAEIKRRSPLFNLIEGHAIHEGDETFYETVEKREKKLELKKAEASFNLTREEMSRITFPEIMERIDEVVNEMVRQMEVGVFGKINRSVEESGNVIPGNPPFSPEGLLKGLEVIDIDFDDARDKPRMPTVFIHPSQWEKFREIDNAMTPEQKADIEQRQQAILDKKYEEYVAREGHRKLVD